MSIKKILVPVRGDGNGEGLLDHALALAARTGSHIEVVHSHSQPKDLLPYGTLMMTSSMKKSILESAAANAAEEEVRLRNIFDDYCKRHNLLVTDRPATAANQISISWREEVGMQAHIVSMQGRLADLIVVARPDKETNLGVNTLESALLETGKLVMMAPPVRVGDVGKHIAISWNGDSRAARTITLALSVLKGADKVTILSAERAGSGRLNADQLADYLAWHDIDVTLEKFDASRHGVGATILNSIKKIGADTLLMGGYGHSRRRELIMGGVTQHVTENAEIPIFMAH